jgi:hypothetical protein
MENQSNILKDETDTNTNTNTNTNQETNIETEKAPSEANRRIYPVDNKETRDTSI